MSTLVFYIVGAQEPETHHFSHVTVLPFWEGYQFWSFQPHDFSRMSSPCNPLPQRLWHLQQVGSPLASSLLSPQPLRRGPPPAPLWNLESCPLALMQMWEMINRRLRWGQSPTKKSALRIGQIHWQLQLNLLLMPLFCSLVGHLQRLVPVSNFLLNQRLSWAPHAQKRHGPPSQSAPRALGYLGQ